MKVLVAYASRHGATRGIAERIAQSISRAGHEVTLRPADQADGVDRYDAFVVGSAAYAMHWLKEAAQFVTRHRALLATRPTWLFSSGPIGTDKVDAKGRDVLEASKPAEFADFDKAIGPREMKVFFGAFDPDAEPIGLLERMGSWFMRLPSIRRELPAGDFRDWPAIEAWADGIAADLKAGAAS